MRNCACVPLFLFACMAVLLCCPLAWICCHMACAQKHARRIWSHLTSSGCFFNFPPACEKHCSTGCCLEPLSKVIISCLTLLSETLGALYAFIGLIMMLSSVPQQGYDQKQCFFLFSVHFWSSFWTKELKTDACWTDWTVWCSITHHHT